MGKKLVIKGADFSENGFVYEIVKKEITALYDSSGSLVGSAADFNRQNGTYFYEKTETGALTNSQIIGAFLSTTPYYPNGQFIEVEDYTDAEITTVNTLGPTGPISGAAVLFFLDANKQIIGGLSTGESIMGCENVGTFSTPKTLQTKIPAGSVYCVASMITAENAVATGIENFKITLSKKVFS